MAAAGSRAPKGGGAGSSARGDRCAALQLLQDTQEGWWEGIDVLVPWAALGKSHSSKAGTFHGCCMDAVEKDDALLSVFTIEDPEFDDDAIFITGAQLAGVEGFGSRDERCECAEIDEAAAKMRQSGGAATSGAAAPRPKGRAKPKANKAAAAATARAEADADGIDPLGAFCEALDGEEAGAKASGAKLRQGWIYEEYVDDLSDPRLKPAPGWAGITHPRLRRRAYDAAEGKLPVIHTHDATFPPAAFEWMHRELIGCLPTSGLAAPIAAARAAAAAPAARFSLAETCTSVAQSSTSALRRGTVACCAERACAPRHFAAVEGGRLLLPRAMSTVAGRPRRGLAVRPRRRRGRLHPHSRRRAQRRARRLARRHLRRLRRSLLRRRPRHRRLRRQTSSAGTRACLHDATRCRAMARSPSSRTGTSTRCTARRSSGQRRES